MGRRKRSTYNRSKLGKRYQSDWINVTQRPRSLIIDPICDMCRGLKKLKNGHPCPRCRGTGEDPEGDKWFDNQDRVRSTYGPKQDRTPLTESTWTTRKVVHEFVETPFGWKVEKRSVIIPRPIPKTVGVGATIVHIDVDKETGEVSARFDMPAKSAVDYTNNNLPIREVVKSIEQIKSTERLTLIERLDKWVYPNQFNKKIRMFFGGDKYCFVEDHGTHEVRSLVYTGREYALEIMRRGKIRWMEVLKPKS